MFKLTEPLNLFLMAILIVVVVIISGCIPAKYTYWAPTGQGGRLSNSAANSSIAASDQIEFSFDGTKIRVLGSGTGVGVSLRIPIGRSVSFLSDHAELRENELSAIMKKINFDMTSLDPVTMKRIHFNPTNVLSGDLFVTDIEFGGQERIQYTIILPPIKIDNQIYEIPEVKFTKKEGFGIFGP